jgi:hypothetical protein
MSTGFLPGGWEIAPFTHAETPEKQPLFEASDSSEKLFASPSVRQTAYHSALVPTGDLSKMANY